MSVRAKAASSGRGSDRADDGEYNGSTDSPCISPDHIGVCDPLRMAPTPVDVEAVALALMAELRMENPGLPGGSVVNHELAVAFVRRYMHMVAELGVERAQPRVVFHGTARSNFGKIIAGNLRVPDGATVVSASGRSTYGIGIYVSTSFDLALMYGRKHAAHGPDAQQPPADAGGVGLGLGGGGPGGGDEGGAGDGGGDDAVAGEDFTPGGLSAQRASQVVFVCLSLPGRQHVSVPPMDTSCRAVRPGHDSHVSADKGGQIGVFFESCQLLPAFFSTRDSLVCAQEAAVRAVDVLLRATPLCAAAKSSDGEGSTHTDTAEGVATLAGRRAGSEPKLYAADETLQIQTQPLDKGGRRGDKTVGSEGWLLPPPIPRLAMHLFGAAARGQLQHALCAQQLPETTSAQRFGTAASAPAQHRPPGDETGAEGETAGARPRALSRAAPSGFHTAPSGFHTAEWDGVAKRVKYS